MNLNRLFYVAAVIAAVIIICSCSTVKWQLLQDKDQIFTVKVPDTPRHFRMEGSSSFTSQSYDQWTISSTDSQVSYFVVVSDLDTDYPATLDKQQLLNTINKPAIGFLHNATPIKSRMLQENDLLYLEEHWLLEKKINKAVTRSCINQQKIYMLICLFPANQELPQDAQQFFSSFKIN